MLFSSIVKTQEIESLDEELNKIEEQILEADNTLDQYEGGAISEVARLRKEVLLLLHSILELRSKAQNDNIPIQIVIPVVEPDPQKADEILIDLNEAKEQLKSTELEVSSTGGLSNALALMRLETEKLTIAHLQLGYYQAKYGLAISEFGNESTNQSNISEQSEERQNIDSSSENLTQVIQSTIDSIEDRTSETEKPISNVEWADPNFPNIDYNTSPFKLANKDGDVISGWWTISQENAAIDDSPIVRATNWSNYDSSRIFEIGDRLLVRCREAETAIIFSTDDFLIAGFDRYSFDITYRIDEDPAQNSVWSSLTSNQGAGLFGVEAIKFLKRIYDAEKLFIRLKESRGQTHDAIFDLAGIKNTINLVGNACNWVATDQTQAMNKTIQETLNKLGFSAGTPDGIWGKGSQSALRNFQNANGLNPTGIPNPETLEKLGIH